MTFRRPSRVISASGARIHPQAQALPEELVHRSERQNRLSRSKARQRQRGITSDAQISKGIVFDDRECEFLCQERNSAATRLRKKRSRWIVKGRGQVEQTRQARSQCSLKDIDTQADASLLEYLLREWCDVRSGQEDDRAGQERVTRLRGSSPMLSGPFPTTFYLNGSVP